MKLYFSKGACSLAVRIIINELNLATDFIEVNLKEKKTAAGDDFLVINPKGAVPVLETSEGQLLTENFVILQYLADSSQAMQLCPATGQFERYRVLEWGSFIATELHKGIGILFNPMITEAMKNQFFLPMIDKKLKFLDKNLIAKTYLLGDEFTIADAYCFVVLSWTPHFNIDLQIYPEVVQYYRRLQQRPAIVKSLQQEGLI